MKDFGDLHSHSDYSIFDGFATLDDKIKRAKEIGYTALAMTEHGTTTGLMDFYLKCKKEGIKPILGYEGYFSFEPDIKGGDTFHIILLAKDLTGYKNLLKIATYGTNHFYKKPRIGIECLKEYSDGIICATACVAGLFSSDKRDEIIPELKDIFGDDFYLEVQPHKFEEQIIYNYNILNYAKENDYKVIITGDSHYVLKEDTETHRQWLGLGKDSEYYSSGDFHLQTKEEMEKFFLETHWSKDKINAAFDNVAEIINKCNVEIPLGEKNYPKFTDNPDEYIRKRCNEGWFKKKINLRKNKEEYQKQVVHELNVLETCGYKNYICIIDDMLRWCRENNIPTGIGRGSVGGSTTAYLMDITDVDPIQYNLIFERFANPERVTDCDIDCDVSTSGREKVINYVREKYGEVYQVRTISYLGDKSALQRAGQALGIAPREIDKISKDIVTLDDLSASPLKTLAMKFKGHIASYGKHASAVVVFPKDSSNWCAIEKTGDDLVAAQDFHLLEKQGIMKLDILGLETLDVIAETLALIGEKIDLSNIPLKDDKVASLIDGGDVCGMFQVSSQKMKELMQSIKASSVEDMIDTVALGRPGVLDTGMDKVFIKRRNGQEEITYEHEKLIPILKDTEGIILYQEQIMKIAQSLCGFSYGKADNIRRIIGRKVVEEMQPAIDEMMVAGIKNGIPKDTMKDICDLIVTFANYGFNKGHAAAYGITAWRTAWLKAYYPVEFMTALINSATKNKEKFASYIEGAIDMGIRVIQPSIVSSQSVAIPVDGDILLGFNSISGVGNTEVENGHDFDTYVLNSNHNKKVLKNLVKAGAFDDVTNKSRDEMLEYIDWVKDKRKKKGEFIFSGNKTESKGMMEFSVIGFSFTDVFSEYDLYLENARTASPYLIMSVKTTKTRQGKPMSWVQASGREGVIKLCCFMPNQKEIEKGSVYLLSVTNGVIRDFLKAKLKSA